MSNGKQTGSPYCKVCESHHSPRDPHNYKDTPTLESLIAKVKGMVCTQEPKIGVHKPKKVATKPKNVATPNDNVATRRISIRELNQGISKHFTQLPFVVTKNGKDIARVIDI